MRAHIFKLAAVALLGGLIAGFLVSGRAPSGQGAAMTGRGDVRTLRAGYERWKTAYAYKGGDRKLILSLQYSKGRSARFTRAHGQATLDLADGSLSVVVSGLSDQDTFDLWLIDNRSGRGQSVKPEARDLRVRVGSLKHEGGTATLQARLSSEVPRGFEIDLMVVARSGEDPRAAGLLFGSPTLFERLYYSEQRGQLAASSQAAGAGLLSAPFGVLIPSPAYAGGTAGVTNMEALIAKGRDIFFNETFDGNGRTCGSCHPEQNNFTLDPRFIATLPAKDPLFVAEFNPALKNLEKPELMRQFGLILENVDGFDDDPSQDPKRFVMRGVPHTLALLTSLDPAPAGVDGTTTPPSQRTGWGGDGAPEDGTLREFAIGAVKQHFTKTLKRREKKGPEDLDADFRLPTKDELDALEAFQLSLGRQVDEDLSKLTFRSPLVEEGKQLFFGEERCNLCHVNAGASAAFPSDPPITGNANFNTGVEDLPVHPAGTLPRDGGFGREFDVITGGFGNGTFNTPPLVEAADTGPFFHNNAVVTTIEDAVRFYGTDAFNDSPAGQKLSALFQGERVEVGDNEARAIGAFLRAINALENIRSSIALQERAQDAHGLGNARDLLRLSISEINDAIGVLRGAGLHPGARLNLRAARELVEVAANIRLRFVRNIFIRLAIDEAEAARRRMVEN